MLLWTHSNFFPFDFPLLDRNRCFTSAVIISAAIWPPVVEDLISLSNEWAWRHRCQHRRTRKPANWGGKAKDKKTQVTQETLQHQTPERGMARCGEHYFLVGHLIYTTNHHYKNFGHYLDQPPETHPLNRLQPWHLRKPKMPPNSKRRSTMFPSTWCCGFVCSHWHAVHLPTNPFFIWEKKVSILGVKSACCIGALHVNANGSQSIELLWVRSEVTKNDV